MKSLRYLREGWVEIVTATLLAALSIQAGVVDRIPWASVGLDMLALVAVLVAVKWLRIGTVLTLAVALLTLFVDPELAGVSIYICMLPALSAIRRDAVPVAVLLTAVNIGVGWLTSFYMGSGGDPFGVVLTWVVLYAIVWGVGLGMRAAGRNEAARVGAEYRRKQLELALELHDSVCRDLSMLVMQADTVTARGEASPEQLEDLAERARSANQAVREVARLLGGATRAQAPEVRLESALRAGTHELRSLGFTVQTTAELVGDLPTEVDETAGRILQEALHNVARHGDSEQPCVVDVDRSSEGLVMTVTNHPSRGRGDRQDRMGIQTMRERASQVGGTVNAREVAGKWVCAISLPLSHKVPSDMG